MEAGTALAIDAAPAVAEPPPLQRRPAGARDSERPAPPSTDAATLDWPLERWTGPQYVLGRGRPVGRRGPGWEGWIVIGLASCAGAGVLIGQRGWLAAAEIVALLAMAGLYAGRRRWLGWLAAALTPATARRLPPAPSAMRHPPAAPAVERRAAEPEGIA
jgi:hypothetical protein